MGSLHNDIHSWAGSARAKGCETIEIDLDTADAIVSALLVSAKRREALEPFARVARWARLCGMSDLEKATAKYAKRNLSWDQFSAADAVLQQEPTT